MKTFLAILALSLLAGCAHRDYRDRAWDPKPGHQLFEQMPNWDGEAVRVCGKTTTLC